MFLYFLVVNQRTRSYLTTTSTLKTINRSNNNLILTRSAHSGANSGGLQKSVITYTLIGATLFGGISLVYIWIDL